MNITIETESGVKITAPEQKWLVGLLVMMASLAPAQFAEVCRLVDNKVDAYAAVPESVQRSLTGRSLGS